MSFLDWIKRRGSESGMPSRPDTNRNLFAEWRQDHQLAKQRNETGREPESRPLEKTAAPKRETKKAPARRERLKDHDIPF